MLGGNRRVDSQLELSFLEPVPKEKQKICSQVLDAAAVESLSRAVRNHYWFELFLDDLPVSFDFLSFILLFFPKVAEGKKQKKTQLFFPFLFSTCKKQVWGFIGSPPSKDSEELYIYTHRAFDISYNGDEFFSSSFFFFFFYGGLSRGPRKRKLYNQKKKSLTLLSRPIPLPSLNHLLPFSADRIIQVNLTSENPKPIAEGTELTFTYEVRWAPDASGTPFVRRFERYLDRDFFQHGVHWWALANAAATVAFLTALVAAILVRALRADVARYNGASSSVSAAARALGSSPSRTGDNLGGNDFDGGDFDDESGWKVLSGDVFRTPKRLPLLSALVGTGAQLCLLALLTSAAAALGSLFAERGAVATAAVVLYALTSVVGGHVAGETFTRLGSSSSGSGGGKAGSSSSSSSSGKAQQTRAWLLTAALLPLSTFAVGGLVNAVALLYGSLAAVPLSGVAGVLALWLLLSAPLCRLGFALGRRRWQRRLLLGGGGGAGGGGGSGSAGDPARTKKIPSPIPNKPWHRSRAAVCLLAGLLPFLSILVEVSYVFAALWNYKVLYLYWTLLLALALLLAAAALSSVVAVYSLLCAEDHRWHWAAFGAGFSPAAYVFVYCVRYFFVGTRMGGIFQGCFYFGWSLLLSLALGTATGSVGFLASAAFVRRIYRSVKCD